MELYIDRDKVPQTDMLHVELECYFPGKSLVPYLEAVEVVDPMFILVAMKYSNDEGIVGVRKQLEKTKELPAWEYFYNARWRFCREKCKGVEGDKLSVWRLALNVYNSRARKFLREQLGGLEMA